MDRNSQDHFPDQADRHPPGSANSTQRPGAGLFKRAAGTVAVVAVLIVGNTGSAAAAAPSAVSTLSSGTYTWHVAPHPSALPGNAVPLTTAATDPTDDQGPQHGESPVVDADGSVHIRRWQSGAVVHSGDETVTVLSPDGYLGVYRIGTTLDLRAIADGASVTVVGTVEAPSIG